MLVSHRPPRPAPQVLSGNVISLPHLSLSSYINIPLPSIQTLSINLSSVEFGNTVIGIVVCKSRIVLVSFFGIRNDDMVEGDVLDWGFSF